MGSYLGCPLEGYQKRGGICTGGLIYRSLDTRNARMIAFDLNSIAGWLILIEPGPVA
jgi:hypothetical protein